VPRATAAVSRHSTRTGKSFGDNATAATVILAGIAKLLVGQRRFAEALGLPYTRVFAEECQVFRDNAPETILRNWLRDRDAGPNNFSFLIDDLVEHNLALCAALDGVARESISRLSPAAVKAVSFSIFGWRPFAWLTFRRLHRAYSTNDYLRHQELVVKGFAKTYCAHRETLRHAKSRLFNRPNPQTKKEAS
jgi:hypothetical protein